MLKINKILSKKIIFPRSLRGLFLFCHSRESGNPSSPSFRGAKRRSNLNGFSLIELMVAVAILALVSFGIFQAFTTAFQTLNDAKDRTMATNYAQQTLEDYKNTHFEKIISFYNHIGDTKFTQNVTKYDVNENLKKVNVEISWTGRNNITKYVNVSTLIYDAQTIAEIDSTPAGIIIYADRYNLLPGNDTRAVPSNIYAEIVDEKGDLITDWNESYVDFSIESVVNLENETQGDSYLGGFSDTNYPPTQQSVALIQGEADITFYQLDEEREGYVQIKASITIDGVGEIYDTLILKVTNEAVAIVLTSDKEVIRTEGGEEGTANITATIVDAGGDTVDTDREINISIFSGPGTLTNLIPVDKGEAYVDLVSGIATGTSTIMATSNLLEPGSVDIEIVDPGENKISVETDDDDRIIVQQGSANITAYLTDYLNNPTSGKSIEFSTTKGTFEDGSKNVFLTTFEDGSATVFLTMNYADTAIVTASWTNPEDSSVISDTVEFECKNHTLTVSADPPTITEGSETTISAQLINADGDYVASEIINFTITEGSGLLLDIVSTTGVDGIASATLKIDSQGTTTVEGNWSGDPTVVTDDKEVECISAPTYEIELAGSTTISVGDTPTITATVTQSGNPVGSGITVRFSSDDYTNARLDGLSSYVDKTTDGDGLVSVVLSGLTAGEDVVLSAAIGSASDSMTITCEASAISIALADPSNIKHGRGRWGRDELYFNITVTGNSVDLEEIKVAWQPNGSEKLKTVYIDDDNVYSSSGAANNTPISFNRITPYTLTKDHSYTMKMEFNSDILYKNWTITFIHPDTGEDISTVNFYLN